MSNSKPSSSGPEVERGAEEPVLEEMPYEEDSDDDDEEGEKAEGAGAAAGGAGAAAKKGKKAEKKPDAHIAYRYRRFEVTKGFELLVRTTVNAVVRKRSGGSAAAKPAYVALGTLNEWDHKAAGYPMEWRKSADTQVCEGAFILTVAVGAVDVRVHMRRVSCITYFWSLPAFSLPHALIPPALFSLPLCPSALPTAARQPDGAGDEEQQPQAGPLHPLRPARRRRLAAAGPRLPRQPARGGRARAAGRAHGAGAWLVHRLLLLFPRVCSLPPCFTAFPRQPRAHCNPSPCRLSCP